MIVSCRSGIINYIKNYARNIKNSKILDVGCGDGEYTSFFCGKNKVFGLDLQNKIQNKFQPFIEFVTGNAERLPFPNCSFDKVISFDVLEHIQNDIKAVEEIFRVLRKGGYCFLSTPNRNRFSNQLLTLIGRKRNYPLKLSDNCIHIREYTKQDLEQKFIKAKFKEIKITPFWFGLRSKYFDLGVENSIFLKNYCQYWFVKCKK
ncbi:MAG: methyltransferase domain-containing protein [Candidatus Omnitrophota bacterium]